MRCGILWANLIGRHERDASWERVEPEIRRRSQEIMDLMIVELLFRVLFPPPISSSKYRYKNNYKYIQNKLDTERTLAYWQQLYRLFCIWQHVVAPGQLVLSGHCMAAFFSGPAAPEFLLSVMDMLMAILSVLLWHMCVFKSHDVPLGQQWFPSEQQTPW